MKEMIDGYGAIDVCAFPSVHKGKCVQCHMPPTTISRGDVQLGGNHTFKIIEPEVATKRFPIPIVTNSPTPKMPYSACSGAKGCHTRPNEPYGSLAAGHHHQRQEWTHAKVDEIWAALDVAAVNLGYADTDAAHTALVAIPQNQWTTAQRAFLSSFTNVEFVESEGSFGLHNWDYSREIVNMAMSQAKIAQTGVVVKMPWVVTLSMSKIDREGRHHRQVHAARQDQQGRRWGRPGPDHEADQRRWKVWLQATSTRRATTPSRRRSR